MPDDQQNATSPEQRFVPTDRHRRPVRGCRRHLRDCWHFYPKADPADYEEHRARLAVDPTARVSYIRPASQEKMRTIPPCSTCRVD